MRKTLWAIIFGLILSVMMVLPAFSTGKKPEIDPGKLPTYKIRVMLYAAPIDDVEAIKEDRIKNFLEEKFNLEITWMAGFPDNYKERVTTMMAAGDAAELINSAVGWLVDDTTWKKWLADDVLVDLGEYVYGQPERYSNMKLAFDHPYYKMWNEYYTGDGEKYVAWYSAGEAKHNQTGIFFNGKMMKELNIKMPETVDELIAALRKVKREKDIPGLGWVSYRGNYWGQIGWWFFETYGSHLDGYWEKPDGTWYDAAIAPENKALWNQLQGWYAEGLLDPKWLTTEPYDWGYTDFLGDRLFCGGFFTPHPDQYAGYFNNTFKAKYPDAVPEEDLPMLPKPLKGPKGDSYKQVLTTLSCGYQWVIPYTAEYPDRILDLMNYLVSDEGAAIINYGVKGIHYTKDDFSDFNLEEFLKDTAPFRTSEPDRSQYFFFQTFLNGNQKHSPFVGTGDWIEGIKKGWHPWQNRPGMVESDPALQYAIPIHEAHMEVANLDRPPYFNMISYSDEEAATIQKLKDYRIQWFTKFLLGEKDVDKEWDTFVQGYKELGADELAAAYQQKLKGAEALLNRYTK